MSMMIIMVAIILFSCILAEKFSGKFGLPALILFMGIGMIFGSDGIFRISFEPTKMATLYRNTKVAIFYLL